MRPDFVTEESPPTLDKLARAGVRFRNHHAVYPTATDVNGAALATGCYPNRNGLAANLEFRPAINSRQPIDMGNPDSIRHGDEDLRRQISYCANIRGSIARCGKESCPGGSGISRNAF